MRSSAVRRNFTSGRRPLGSSSSVLKVLINICYNAVLLQVAGEEWGENKKDWVEKVGEKKMAAVFSYDRARGNR